MGLGVYGEGKYNGLLKREDLAIKECEYFFVVFRLRCDFFVRKCSRYGKCCSQSKEDHVIKIKIGIQCNEVNVEYANIIYHQ